MYVYDIKIINVFGFFLSEYTYYINVFLYYYIHYILNV